MDQVSCTAFSQFALYLAYQISSVFLTIFFFWKMCYNKYNFLRISIFHNDLGKQITFIIYVSPFCCWQQNADVIDVCNTELIDTFMWPVSRFTLRLVN